jgi:hypothetical protein
MFLFDYAGNNMIENDMREIFKHIYYTYGHEIATIKMLDGEDYAFPVLFISVRYDIIKNKEIKDFLEECVVKCELHYSLGSYILEGDILEMYCLYGIKN